MLEQIATKPGLAEVIRQELAVNPLFAASMQSKLQSIQNISHGAIHATERFIDLDAEKVRLQRQIFVLTSDHSDLTSDKQVANAGLAAFQEANEKLEAIIHLQHLTDRVGTDAIEALKGGSRSKDLFDTTVSADAFVISIDLRRSTELMLKARKPLLFAEFITSLAGMLKTIILDRYGVFDKFTGDGILAFFPKFYSGGEVGLLAVQAAKECHQLVAQHYRNHRSSFTNVLKDTGLGIGIDYGEVSIVQMSKEITVVGVPVVYASRRGSAKAGRTLVNQPAYEQLLDNFSEFLDFSETAIDFKHEGAMVVYNVIRNEKAFPQTYPLWHPLSPCNVIDTQEKTPVTAANPPSADSQ